MTTAEQAAADLNRDPLAFLIAARFNAAYAETTGRPIADKRWLAATALDVANAARNWIREQEAS